MNRTVSGGYYEDVQEVSTFVGILRSPFVPN